MPNISLADQKAALRQQMLEKRKVLASKWMEADGQRLVKAVITFCSEVDTTRKKTIAGYVPMLGECNILPALQALAKEGWGLCLPVVHQPDSPLTFRRWAPGDALVPGPHATHMPEETAGDVTPDILLVPLLVFDKTGHRLGMGGGYYDRTLELLRRDNPSLIALGIAYAGQEMEALPAEENDQRLDAVMTEKGLLSIR